MLRLFLNAIGSDIDVSSDARGHSVLFIEKTRNDLNGHHLLCLLGISFLSHYAALDKN